MSLTETTNTASPICEEDQLIEIAENQVVSYIVGCYDEYYPMSRNPDTGAIMIQEFYRDDIGRMDIIPFISTPIKEEHIQSISQEIKIFVNFSSDSEEVLRHDWACFYEWVMDEEYITPEILMMIDQFRPMLLQYIMENGNLIIEELEPLSNASIWVKYCQVRLLLRLENGMTSNILREMAELHGRDFRFEWVER